MESSIERRDEFLDLFKDGSRDRHSVKHPWRSLSTVVQQTLRITWHNLSCPLDNLDLISMTTMVYVLNTAHSSWKGSLPLFILLFDALVSAFFTFFTSAGRACWQVAFSTVHLRKLNDQWWTATERWRTATERRWRGTTERWWRTSTEQRWRATTEQHATATATEQRWTVPVNGFLYRQLFSSVRGYIFNSLDLTQQTVENLIFSLVQIPPMDLSTS